MTLLSSDGTQGMSSWSSGGSREGLTILGAGRIMTTVKEIMALKDSWSARDEAFKEYDDILAMVDTETKKGIESMVANSAKTLFGLSKFMVSSSIPQRTVVVGDQGPRERSRAGKAERAVYAWWQAVDEERLRRGEEPWQATMAYWMCLYGWYASLGMTAVGKDGQPKFIAIPFDPKECFPEYGVDGLRSFVHLYDTRLGEAIDKAKLFGTFTEGRFAGDRSIGVRIADYWRKDGDDVINEVILLSGDGMYLKEPEKVALKEIPVLCGSFGGVPSRSRTNWMKDLGSVLADNKELYKNFDKWLSFMMQLAKEHAKAPIVAKGIELDGTKMQPASVRDDQVVIETDNPEASIERANVGAMPIDIVRVLTMLQSMEQRGGFPEPAYGGLMVEISGFGISQLLQAAERRIGPQVGRLSQIDQAISKRWLMDFRDNDFPSIAIEGFEGGNPRKAFYEDFEPKDVPKKFRVSTNIPIRIANDMMTRMSIARQAAGDGQLLDMFTVLDEVLQMQDPELIVSRVSEDHARTLAEPLVLAMDLRTLAAKIRTERKPDSEKTAKLVEAFADQMVQQQEQATAPAQKQRINPEALPPEAKGVSPDQVRAGMQLGPAPNRSAQAQKLGVEL